MARLLLRVTTMVSSRPAWLYDDASCSISSLPRRFTMSPNPWKSIFGSCVISSCVIICLTLVALYRMPESWLWRNTSVRFAS